MEIGWAADLRLLAPTLAVLLAGLTVIFVGGLLAMVARDLNDGRQERRQEPGREGEGDVMRGELNTWDRF